MESFASNGNNMKNNKETFEEALRSLENSVDRLESGDLSLEESLRCFEDGVKNLSLCRKFLANVETRVEMLIKEQGGSLVLEKFEEDSESRGS